MYLSNKKEGRGGGEEERKLKGVLSTMALTAGDMLWQVILTMSSVFEEVQYCNNEETRQQSINKSYTVAGQTERHC